jgi:hypothetical protein
MASALPPILVEIQADVAQLKKGLADATTAIKGMDDNVKQASGGMSNFIGKLKTVGATLGATFAASQFTQFAKDTVMAASNMAESVSKVAVVFGEGAAEVYKFGESAAENMGISNQAALEAAGTYGNLFQAFGMGQGEAQKMSMNLVQLASDMASFNNTSIDDAILALRSGLSGETEPLKKFGVALNDVRLRAEAAALGLGEYKGVLPPLVKSQAAYSLIMKDTALSQGDYARTAEGTANTMKTLQAKFMDAKVALGEALMPAFRGLLKILELLIPVIKAFGDFIKKYKDDIKAFAVGVGIATAAWGAYKIATNLAAIATKLMTIAQKGLNAALKANPIGLIITAVGLLAVGIKRLWDNSETFRKVVISVAKAALNAFASIIPMVAQVFEAIMKIVTGPMRLFLTALSKLPGVGKYAKSGLDMINKGLDGISDFGKKAADKATELSKKLDGMAKIAKKAGEEVDKATKGPKRPPAGDVGAGEAAKQEKARVEKLDKLKKQVTDVYQDMNEVIADANEKAQDALETRNERIAEAHERYNERVAELTEQYNERIAEATERHKEQEANIKERYNEQMAEAQKRYQEADKAARKRNTEELIKIAKDYAEKTKDLEIKLQEKLADLQAKAIEKKTDLTVKAAEKQAGIVQQSIARLTSAFASGTAFSLTDMFKKGKEGGGLLGVMKKQLDDAKKLQEGAGYLAGQGYSQTFIEQVVKAGPEAGLALIEEIKGGSPEQQAEIKATFNALETISDAGMDALAKSMNNGANLATSELRKAYDQVAVDLKASLEEVDKELTENMASQQAAFNLAMAEAAKVRDERIAESHKVLEEALAEATKNLLEAQAEAKAEQDKALAEAYAALTKAREEAQKDLNKGLAKAQEELQKALIEAQKAYEKAIDKINEETQKKLDKLKAKIAEIAAAMAALAAMSASMAAMANVPVYTPIVASGGGGSGGSKTSITGPTTNVSITGVNLTSPHDTATAVVNSIKFGNVVVPTAPTKLASGESGAIGAANISSRTVTTTPKIDMHTAAMRAR